MRKIIGLMAALAVVAAFGLCLNNTFAGEEAPAKPAPTAKAKEAPATPAATVKTKTETPLCSMMGWVSEQIKTVKGAKEGCCSSAMKAWFAGDKNVPLAGMRDRLVADGWTADSTIAFFKKMAAERAAKSGECSGCDKGCGDKAAGDCSGCDKGCGDKAAGDCSGCDKEKCDKGECPCDSAKSDCEGCDKAKKDAAKPAKSVGS